MGGDFGLTRMAMSVIRTHQRETERQRKYALKMQAFEAAEREVDDQHLSIRTLTSFHKECPPDIDWSMLAMETPPIRPIRTNREEAEAYFRREQYVPGFLTRILSLTKYRINRLEMNVKRARNMDEMRFHQEMDQFQKQYGEWEIKTNLAKNILNKDLESYKSVIQEFDFWSEIKEIGKFLSIEIQDSKKVEISVKDNSSCIPRQRIRALKRGGVSITDMPVSLYNEICHNYFCSSAIRVIREVFAALPLDFVQFNIIGDFVNAVTGHPENHPILSVRISRDSLKDVKWDNINPINFVEAHPHRVNFKKTKGFSAVEKL